MTDQHENIAEEIEVAEEGSEPADDAAQVATGDLPEEMTAEEGDLETSAEEADEDVEELPADLPDANEFEPELQSALIEAVLFASGEPLGLRKLCHVTRLPEATVSEALESIQLKFELDDSGVELKNVAGQYQFRSKTAFAPFLSALKAERPKKLSPAALETLAIVAYRQPVVKSDVEKIRGVDATPTLKTLIERRLVRIVGHKQAVGQPALYGTTDRFLKIFGLSSLSELPSLREIREFDADPGETESEEPEQEADLEGAELAEAATGEDASEHAAENDDALPAVGNV